MHDFVTSCISLLENTGSLMYADFPNVDTFHLTTFLKITFISITKYIRKIFQWKEAGKLMGEETYFPKLLISL